ncbi:epoxide hydrolase 4-like [Galleria mellonella]|uniref:Epoxide hydrolase 4-like n=1 Tax=Galleria mellonella TaxID=7137 RepID=A0A6J1X6T0_GALME|nr:epoxide hydrolase 4-like [Galleria mellonella]
MSELTKTVALFVLSNYFTILYSILALWTLTLNYVKNIFLSSSSQKRKLEPPACLFDPKYGLHKYIKVNNVKLHYVESGDSSKPLMLFLHGFPEFWYSWRHQIVEFQKDYWCIAIDMRGYGDSERPEKVSDYKLDILVEDVRDLIRQLGREKCILVSHDWGGIIACRFRDVYPEVLDAVILLASISRESWFKCVFSDFKQMMKSWYVFFFRMPYIPEQLLQLNNLNVFDKSMLVPGKDSITSKDIECYKYWFAKDFAFTYPINYYRANFAYSLPEKHLEENVPMLVAHAENDLYIRHSILDMMKKQYDYIETTIVKDCRHFLQQEEPEKVNKIIREFLIKYKL